MERIATKTTIFFGLIALAGVRAILRTLPSGNTQDWRAQHTARLAHVPPAVPLEPDVLYEFCACENGEPCIRCFDSGAVPHGCGE